MNHKTWHRLLRFFLTMTCLALIPPFCGLSYAQTGETERIRELERRLDENSRIIEKLLERVRDLESKAAPGNSEAAPIAACSQTEAETAAKKVDNAASPPAFLDDVTWLHGFADAGITYSGRKDAKRKGFSVGALDIYLTPQLGTNFKSLIELIFEVNDEGETMAELERLQIGYAFNDQLSLWAGRYHTPLGYWNTAYHHGKQLQTTIQRPKFLDFEEDSGIIPTHMTGLWGTGTLRAGSGRFGYDLYLANGPKIGGLDSKGRGKLDPNTFTDDNHDLAAGLNVRYEFAGALDGLRLGLHAFRSDVDSHDRSGARPGRSDLNLLGGFGAYVTDDWEVIGEFYQFLNRNRNGNSGNHVSSLGFIQAGRLFGSVTPYTRFEFASLDQKDNYFSRLKDGFSYRRTLAGVRYDLTPKMALKLEGNHTRIINRDLDDYFEIGSQFSIRF